MINLRNSPFLWFALLLLLAYSIPQFIPLAIAESDWPPQTAQAQTEVEPIKKIASAKIKVFARIIDS